MGRACLHRMNVGWPQVAVWLCALAMSLTRHSTEQTKWLPQSPHVSVAGLGSSQLKQLYLLPFLIRQVTHSLTRGSLPRVHFW